MSEQQNPQNYIALQVNELYTKFVHEVLKVPANRQHLTTAMIRFDEGHMWLQTAIRTQAQDELNAKIAKEAAEQAKKLQETLKAEAVPGCATPINGEVPANTMPLQ